MKHAQTGQLELRRTTGVAGRRLVVRWRLAGLKLGFQPRVCYRPRLAV